jgi:Calponin homology (CH) domain
MKMKEKLKANPELERQVLTWIETITGEKLTDDVYTSLKTGVVLCKLVNAIKPNIVRSINVKPLAVCERVCCIVRESVMCESVVCERVWCERDCGV